MDELDRFFIDQITKIFINTKENEDLSSYQKTLRYTSLMTDLESHFNIPILESDITDEVDKEVLSLYKEFSNERDFDSIDQEDIEEEYEQDI